MQIKNVRFSYAMLRGPTEEDDRLVEKGFSVTVRLTPAEALALRVPAIVGYNPQKLLPAPSRSFEESFLLNIGNALGLSWDEINEPWTSVSDWAEQRRKLTPDFTGLYDGIPDVTRWNEADSDPLADLQRWKDQVFGRPLTGRRTFWPTDYMPYMTPGEDIVPVKPRDRTFEHKIAVIRHVDFATTEARVLAMLYDKRVRGIIIDVDRLDDDGAEGRRWFPLGEPYKPKPPEPKPEVSTAAGKRDMSYLKHDRTKQHRRRRK